MKRGIICAVLALFVMVNAAMAQPPGPPKPGPEVKKLGYFVGTWKSEGEMKASPFGPGGKFSSTDHNEWMPGNFFVVMHSEGTSPMGSMQEMAVMGYNTEDKVYTYDGFDNFGEHDVSKGTLNGDTWVFNGESKMNGKVMKGRFTMKQSGPSTYTYKFEM